jgi:hypothetical protein
VFWFAGSSQRIFFEVNWLHGLDQATTNLLRNAFMAVPHEAIYMAL